MSFTVNKQCVIVAMRGRGEKNKTKQQLEPQLTGWTNTITSVQKDNLVLEISSKMDGRCYRPFFQRPKEEQNGC